MIFFRKKKPTTPQAEPVKSETELPKKKEAAAPMPKSLQEIAHTRVLTAEGWRRSMEKKLPSKKK